MVPCPCGELLGEDVYWAVSWALLAFSHHLTLFLCAGHPSPLHLSYWFRISFPHLRPSQNFTYLSDYLNERLFRTWPFFSSFPVNCCFSACTTHCTCHGELHCFVPIFSSSLCVLFAAISHPAWLLAWNRLSMNEWMLVWEKKNALVNYGTHTKSIMYS